jgi:hypothetical protein
MANSQKSLVSVVAILAIVILVGMVVYFVMEEANSDIEIDLNLDGAQDAPVQIDRSATVRGGTGPVFHLTELPS